MTTVVARPHPPVGESSLVKFSAVQLARLSMLVDTAEGEWLSTVGGNFGVPRPKSIAIDDDMYREIIMLLAWQPKMIMFTTHTLIGIVLGTRRDIAGRGDRPWEVYEPNANEIVIEVPLELIGTSNDHASYLHGGAGFGFVTGGPSNTFTCKGDLRGIAATTLVGMAMQFNTSSGVWTDYTIAGISYNAGTDVTTVTVSATTLPDGGGFFNVIVPGDDVASYRGDYLAASLFTSAFSTSAPGHTIHVTGDVTGDVIASAAVTVDNGTTLVATTVTSVGSFDPTTNTTDVVVAATLPAGLAGRAIVRDIEHADVAGVPTHADRVYLTGNGLYDVVAFYMDILVRAAGVVVRLELI